MKERGERKNNRQKGADYEKLAGQFLEKQGYRILQYNYRCRFAEIDIVAAKDGYLVFCEVKYRSRQTAASTLEAVNSRKQKRICMGALFYMREHALTEVPCRFDVVGICRESDDQILLIENAFDYSGP